MNKENRVIKFRAWHKDLQDMTFSIKPNDFWWKISEYPEMYEVMQFTGLLDKNKKEIYESDILENPEGKKGVVVFYDGGFKLQIHKSETSAHYISMNEGYVLNKTIVGNIHETLVTN